MPAVYPDLAGKTVFVSGGASGIGASFVAHFAAQGCKVGFVDLDDVAGRALAAALPPGSAAFEACDVRDIAALRASIAKLRAALGPVTVCVNNAARDDRHGWDDVTPQSWDERFAVNLKHQFFATQAVVPDMEAAGGGAVINLGSVSWLVSPDPFVAYKTAKSAVAGLTRALARELGPKNIRVNAILPGWILTKRQRELWYTEDGKRELLARQCLKRELNEADVARVAVFLASDEAGAMTAQEVIVDGGWV
jgi:NAD(P)-dependent dehydrogenase (short-subunit alcohol dehydrogenase family)